ncbi:MAG: hypothetical protein J6K32_10195 [Clostridia bacterium]|nr:hypothetical protein [Clostridia bacterium]
MKTKLNNKKILLAMAVTGLVLMGAGALWGYMLPEEAHLQSRIAGFISGIGSSLGIIGFVLLLRRARLGEEKARDQDLAMTDERGLAVAYRAQSAAAIAAVFALVAITVLALVRGDMLYAGTGSFLMCGVAVVKLVAWHVYNKRM